jgi:hypothetical protein
VYRRTSLRLERCVTAPSGRTALRQEELTPLEVTAAAPERLAAASAASLIGSLEITAESTYYFDKDSSTLAPSRQTAIAPWNPRFRVAVRALAHRTAGEGARRYTFRKKKRMLCGDSSGARSVAKRGIAVRKAESRVRNVHSLGLHVRHACITRGIRRLHVGSAGFTCTPAAARAIREISPVESVVCTWNPRVCTRNPRVCTWNPRVCTCNPRLARLGRGIAAVVAGSAPRQRRVL